jgi:hypothetical protein
MPAHRGLFCAARPSEAIKDGGKQLGEMAVLISAIVDACFRLIVDGESVLPCRRWGSAQELV